MIALLQLEWFGGDKHALEACNMLIRVANTWDDLIDKDKEVPNEKINEAFKLCAIYLPMNPFYRRIQNEVLPMLITVTSAFDVANHYEQQKDEHGLEIAHNLRYALGHVFAYAIHVCVGPYKAAEYLPLMWKVITPDRFADYRAEHLDA